jgi:hypothetical protein
VLPLASDLVAPASRGAPTSAGADVAIETPESVEALAAPSTLWGTCAAEPPDVAEGAAPEVTVVPPEVSVVPPEPEVSVVPPEPEVSVVPPEVSVVPPEVSVVPPEVSDVVTDVSVAAVAGGRGSSARAVSTNAEAQRKAATRAAVHPKTRTDRRPSQRGSRTLKTTTELPSSTLSSQCPTVAFSNVEVLHLTPETQALDVAGRACGCRLCDSGMLIRYPVMIASGRTRSGQGSRWLGTPALDERVRDQALRSELVLVDQPAEHVTAA